MCTIAAALSTLAENRRDCLILITRPVETQHVVTEAKKQLTWWAFNKMQITGRRVDYHSATPVNKVIFSMPGNRRTRREPEHAAKGSLALVLRGAIENRGSRIKKEGSREQPELGKKQQR